jgi:hypothetical protein
MTFRARPKPLLDLPRSNNVGGVHEIEQKRSLLLIDQGRANSLFRNTLI